MTYTFESCFAARIEDFIVQKNALGFGYLESSRLLRDFDRFCMTHFPEENFLTEELCMAWATKKNTEGNNTFRNRMMPVREFARYLNRNGEAAYVLPPDLARKDAPYAPYIYTEDEILTIWDVFDHLKPRGGFPVRQYVIPAMVKLMYCCGLRPAEARRLRVSDVDLEIGRLNIMESKQHRSRIVMMAEDVIQMLSDCNAIVASVMPEREPFFPNSEGGFYGKRGLEKTFRQVLKKAAITGTGCRSPRLYDFRHTFATMALENGMDVKTLSAIVGHVSSGTTLNIYAHVTDEMRRSAAAKIDQGIAKAEVEETAGEREEPEKQPFTPVKPPRRCPGTGCVSHIRDHLWEGRYSPVWPDGKKHARNVYAKTEAECEEKLKALIREMKAEIALTRGKQKRGGVP